MTDGRGYLTLDFSDRKWEAGKLELDIMPGDYRILTGNRLPNGNILGKRYDFHIEKDENEAGGTGASGVLSGGNVQPSFHSGFQADRSGWKSSAGVQIDGKISGDAAKCENGIAERGILFWLEEDREPTVHILNEIMELKEKYEKIQKQIIFILRSEESLKNATSGEMSGTAP